MQREVSKKEYTNEHTFNIQQHAIIMQTNSVKWKQIQSEFTLMIQCIACWCI